MLTHKRRGPVRVRTATSPKKAKLAVGGTPSHFDFMTAYSFGTIRVREHLLPSKQGDPRVELATGVSRVLRAGIYWQHRPERYGKWKSIHARFTRWARGGVWEKVSAELIKDRDNNYLMLDTTLACAHHFRTPAAAPGAEKRGPMAEAPSRKPPPIDRAGRS